MKRAAIYARRSTDEHQEASLSVQVEEARGCISRQGWSVEQRHVFLGDAVSRAEFRNRPALHEMKAAAERGEFDILVARDASRIGGDTIRYMYLLQELADVDVEVYYYYAGEWARIGGPMEKMMVCFHAATAEHERQNISQRTHESHLVRFRNGFVVGGSVFGYDNVAVQGGKVRVINESQAEIVREIFALYAEGVGLRGIAKKLNAREEPSPSAGKRGTGSWSPNCIREMLRRELYNGTRVWNRTKKDYRAGTQVRDLRPEHAVLRVEAPELRIIDERTWAAVQKKIQAGKRQGVKAGAPAKYLLSGIARCGECGGPLQAINRRVRGQNTKFYACARHRSRGVCGNTVARPVTLMDRAVLDVVGKRVLTDDIVEKVLKGVTARLNQSNAAHERELRSLSKRRQKLQQEINNIVGAIAKQPDSSALVVALKAKEDALTEAERAITACEARRPIDDLQVRRLRNAARDKLRDLRATMARNPVEARGVLQAVLPEGRIVCTPQHDPKRYIMKAPLGVPEGLFGGSEQDHYSGVPSGV